MIQQVQQKSTRGSKPWGSDVVLATAGLTLNVSGTYYDGNTAFPLNASIPLTAPSSGVDHHELQIATDGTLILDPAPNPSKTIYAQIAWFDLPAGTVDLAAITINQLVHVPEV